MKTAGLFIFILQKNLYLQYKNAAQDACLRKWKMSYSFC